MTDIADILALAEMYSELTKCSLETALTDISGRVQAERDYAAISAADQVTQEMAQLPPPAAAFSAVPSAELPELPAHPYQPALLPYSKKAFQGAMKWATPGQGYTVAELCLAAGIKYPSGSKTSTHMLTAAGWTKTDIRRYCQGSKCSVYVKPVATTLAEYRAA